MQEPRVASGLLFFFFLSLDIRHRLLRDRWYKSTGQPLADSAGLVVLVVSDDVWVR